MDYPLQYEIVNDERGTGMDARLIAAPLLALALVSPVGALVGNPHTRFDLGKAGKDGVPAGWELKVKDGSASKYFESDKEVKGFCLRCASSSFSVQRHISVNAKDYPYVTWRWKVKKLPDGADFRESGKDDQAAQLFVAFEGNKSISYIWDTTAPVGTTGSFYIPMVVEVKTLVVSSGPEGVGKWVTVTRNVYEDYKKLYGKEPALAEGLRFQINSQYTKTTAEACLERVE